MSRPERPLQPAGGGHRPRRDSLEAIRPAGLTMWRFLRSLTGHSQSVEIGTTGTSVDLAKHLQRLIAAPAGAFLVVKIPAMEDAFVQFTAGPEEIQMDYPLVTEVQASREHAFRRACEAIGRAAYETRASDGSRFLDCNLPRDSVRAAADISRVLHSVFQIQSTTELRFIGESA